MPIISRNQFEITLLPARLIFNAESENSSGIDVLEHLRAQQQAGAAGSETPDMQPVEITQTQDETHEAISAVVPDIQKTLPDLAAIVPDPTLRMGAEPVPESAPIPERTPEAESTPAPATADIDVLELTEDMIVTPEQLADAGMTAPAMEAHAEPASVPKPDRLDGKGLNFDRDLKPGAAERAPSRDPAGRVAGAEHERLFGASSKHRFDFADLKKSTVGPLFDFLTSVPQEWQDSAEQRFISHTPQQLLAFVEGDPRLVDLSEKDKFRRFIQLLALTNALDPAELARIKNGQLDPEAIEDQHIGLLLRYLADESFLAGMIGATSLDRNAKISDFAFTDNGSLDWDADGINRIIGKASPLCTALVDEKRLEATALTQAGLSNRFQFENGLTAEQAAMAAGQVIQQFDGTFTDHAEQKQKARDNKQQMYEKLKKAADVNLWWKSAQQIFAAFNANFFPTKK